MKAKKRAFWAGIAILAAGSVAFGATITSIDFENSGGKSEIRLKSDGPIQFDKQVDPNSNQLILELKGAKLSPNASRKLDTSSFEGQVVLVSPYQVEGTEDTSRVVIQLRGGVDPGGVEVTQNGNLIQASLPTGASSSPPPAASNEPPPTAPNGDGATASSAPAAGEAVPTNDALGQFDASQKTKRFKGRKITMILRDAELSDVFQLIGEASGFNVMISSEVKGRITLNMVDVPWDQALEMILHTQQLGAERNGSVLRITTLQSLTAEKQAELAAQQASEASAPRITRVFSINYANLSELANVLSRFAAPVGLAGVVAAGGGGSSIVQTDNRTNSIIVRDTIESIDRMKKLIEVLDTQTPQVLIEAKIVEASETFSRTIGGTLGMGFNGLDPDTDAFQTVASFNGGNPLDTLNSTLGASSVFGSGAASASGANAGRLGVSFAFLPGQARLNAVLDLAETNSQVKVVSSPKTVVLNKESANIVQSTPVIQPNVTVSNGVVTNAFTTVSANLSMNVTPTVTNESSVLLQLNLTRDVPQNLGGGNQGVANRNMSTRVLVDSGNTLVIGGIYTMQTNEAEGGFPWLRKIPILGWFFGSKENQSNRSELFFFITPRILNPRESGLTS